MEKSKLILICLLVKSVELKFFGYSADRSLQNLIAYDSVKIKELANKVHNSMPESFYYSPYQGLSDDMNETSSVVTYNIPKKKRGTDSKFRGRPKSIQEVWARNFNFTSHDYAQATSLVNVMKKVIDKYMDKCIPVVLYDKFIQNSDGFILQRLFKTFPSTFMHGRITDDFRVENRALIDPSGIKCRSLILFISDGLKTRQVIGPQIDNRVIVVPRSTQWKLQEFLASPLSRDLINLLVIGESYSADKTVERPYVLYTHQLYTDGLGNNKPKVLTSWLKGRLSRPSIDLFPMKLTKGFAGHRFSVSAADTPPFVFKIASTDGVGNTQIRWDGYEYRVLQLLGQRLNFTFDIGQPRNLEQLGAGDAVGDSVAKRQFDIGMAGMYVTTDRNIGMEMSVAYETDCAAFVSMSSKALPRYRAILGPFQWQVWLCLTMVYLFAIVPLAYSDSLSIKYLIDKPGQIENMFWYVFGTFTNSLTFAGELTWSNSKKTSTRLLIGFYWVFTIIITACYTGSIIAFVTLPVFPATVDTIEQLRDGFYRVGTLDRGGWERWFQNSTQKEAAKLLKNLEYVRDVQEGLSNVTKPFFLFPYAFIFSKAQLEFITATNYSDSKLLSRRSTLHISDECFALFGVGFAFQSQSVYRQKINDGLLLLQQAGIVGKLKNDVRWEMVRSGTGLLMQISQEKTLRIREADRGLTLADTEGMFLLLGIGFAVAGGALFSEWVGGCTNKCLRIVRIKQAQKAEEIRVEEETNRMERDRILDEKEYQRHKLESPSSSVSGISFVADIESVSAEGEDEEVRILPADSPQYLQVESKEDEACSSKSSSSRHSRASSTAISDLNPAMLAELFHGPKPRSSKIVMIDGKMMSETEAVKYIHEGKNDAETNNALDAFGFLNDIDESEEVQRKRQVCQVEINLQVPVEDVTEEVPMATK